MQLYEFLKIIYENFGNRIFKDNYELEKTNYKRSDIIKNIFLRFIIEDDDDFILFSNKNDNFLAKILNGTESLPTQDAIDINSRMDLDTFQDFFIDADLPSDQIDSLVNDFKNVGEKLSVDNIEEDIFNILKKILFDIINKKKKISIKKAEINGNIVTVGNKTFKLNNKLMKPINNENTNYNYITALIKVYQQDSKINISNIEEINKLPLIYQKHFKLQRESFYNAECVLHQIRDAFYDGELEFNLLKDEIYDGIEEHLIKKYKNGFFRVQKVLEIVVIANFSKSYLSKNNNGLIGPKEKKGIVHMLVNDGRIDWVTEYDEDF